jgi:hypothetical protein
MTRGSKSVHVARTVVHSSVCGIGEDTPVLGHPVHAQLEAKGAQVHTEVHPVRTAADTPWPLIPTGGRRWGGGIGMNQM